MIPKLFDASEMAFTGEGLGTLAECIRCDVTEERNGIYEVEMEYPTNGRLFDAIKTGRYIFTSHDETEVPQAFEIYKITNVLDGIATVYGRHISYHLNTVTVKPYTASNILNALNGIKTNALNVCQFNFWTDKSTVANFKLTEPASGRNILGGMQGSILDTFGGGEFEWDMWTVKLHQHRGANNGVQIRYGKNIASLQQELDAQNRITAVVPFWKSPDGEVVMLPEGIIYGTAPADEIIPIVTHDGDNLSTEDATPLAAGWRREKSMPLDLSDRWEEQPTEAQLRAAGYAYLNNNTPWEVKENIKFDLVPLWQTEEYKAVAPLERVRLCDTVGMYVTPLGILANAECIKIVYSSLDKKNKSVEVGAPKRSLTQTIAGVAETSVLSKVPTTEYMRSVIDAQTALITGGYGGHVKWVYLPDGTPSELLFMDEAREEDATYILRINKNGIGFSQDGGNTYSTAWTIDGSFNASYITSGILRAIQIIGTEIQGGTIDGARFTSLNDIYKLLIWAGTLTMTANDYIRACVYQNTVSGEMVLMSGSSTDANENPADGNALRLSCDGVSLFANGDPVGELAFINNILRLHSNNGVAITTQTASATIWANGTLDFANDNAHISIADDGTIDIDNTKARIRLHKTDGLCIWVDGVGYSGLHFVDDGNGHSVLGV